MTQEEIRATYTWWQRFTYFIKRHLVFIVLLVPGYLYLRAIPVETGPDAVVINPARELTTLMVTRSMKAVLAVWMAVLITKFAFPKMHVQKELVDDQNIAVGLLIGAIIVAMSL